mmetsp:Transcript_17038/g.57332  ORF Transcript_17038/g.57332 Transcript_17038/m.57332 type:complete len:212 (+) Transcript_17038:285-920(+)
MGPRPAATRHLPRISREPSENLPGRDADALGCAVGRFRDMHTCPRRASRVASTRAMPPGPDACCGSDARAPSPRLTAGDWKVQDCRATDEGQRPLQGLRVCRLHQKGGRSQGHRAVQRRPPRRPPAADQPRHRLTLGRRHCRRLEHSGRGCGRQAADSGGQGQGVERPLRELQAAERQAARLRTRRQGRQGRARQGRARRARAGARADTEG